MALLAAPTAGPAAAGEVPAQHPAGPDDGVVVLDTSVLLADPESIFAFGDAEVVLPLKVIEELDNHKARLDDVGRAARTAARSLEALRLRSTGQSLAEPVPLATGGTLRVVINGQKLDRLAQLGLDVDKADNRILAAALGLDGGDRPVRLVSADVNLRLKAATLGLDAVEYVQTRPGFRASSHPGWRRLEVTAGLVDLLYAEHEVDLEDLAGPDGDRVAGLAANEFGVLSAGQQSAMARRRGGRLCLVRRNLEAYGMAPRSKEQRFALDLLLDPTVPVVALSGPAGTGKTLLAVAAGLEQVVEADNRYERLMIIRPMFAVGRQDVGFLPGDLKEKLGPWFVTVEDVVSVLRPSMNRKQVQETIETWATTGQLDMQPVTYLRGRSLQRTFVVLDEAQNCEAAVLKTVLSRLGAGSKIVLVGDVSQIDNPFVSERTSALSVLADRFAGQDLFAHLLLTKGERSAVADLAAELL